MKIKGQIFLLFILVFSIQQATGQRYLKNVFPEKVESVRNISYGQALNYKDTMESLFLDLYEPFGDSSQSRALLIYAHGGGFTGGSRKLPSIELMGEKLARKGYVFATMSYRTDPRFDYFHSDSDRRAVTDAMHDMKAVIRFFKAHQKEYRIDTSNIFISGESAGGITAMTAGYIDKQEELEAYPKTHPKNVEGNSGTPGYASQVKGVLCLCGGIVDTNAIDSPHDSPILVIHGTGDPIAPVAWAEDIIQRAEHIGLKHEKVFYGGATHCPWIVTLPHWTAYLDSTVNYMSHFMYSLITGKTPPPMQKAPPPMHVAEIIQSNMVIQQGKPFKIWGISSRPGDTIQINAGWLKKPVYAYANKNRDWIASLEVPIAEPGNPTPYELQVIHKKDTLKYDSLLIGEVWLCAGQSNMDMKVKKVTGWYDGVLDYEKEIAEANFPAIRVFTEKTAFKANPRSGGVNGKWEICSPKTAGNFSAVAYFFGKKLYQELKVPVGLVVSAAIGASAEAFVPRQALEADPLLKEKYWDPYKSDVESQSVIDSLGFFTMVTRPTLIYNGMIHPLENLSIRGFIWYQGESNYRDGMDYTRLCGAMIKSWRKRFGQGDLPFYFTQIAPYGKNSDKNPIVLPLFWEAQQNLLQLKNTGMALTLDVGDTMSVHPRNKKPVGERLAKIALHKSYGYTNVVYSGPVFKDFKVDGSVVKISYDKSTVGTGLTTNDGKPLRYFALAGKDQVYHPAQAKIVGNQVWVHSEKVLHPKAVRYGFKNTVITNLENKEGLPAMSFRTDNWNK